MCCAAVVAIHVTEVDVQIPSLLDLHWLLSTQPLIETPKIYSRSVMSSLERAKVGVLLHKYCASRPNAA
jgi:hypothetical protein